MYEIKINATLLRYSDITKYNYPRCFAGKISTEFLPLVINLLPKARYQNNHRQWEKAKSFSATLFNNNNNNNNNNNSIEPLLFIP